MKNNRITFTILGIALFWSFHVSGQNIRPSLSLSNSKAEDQDDMCIWIHPTDPALSTIIASDKFANMLFVYDLDGKIIQTVSGDFRPGNIDIRYDFPLANEQVDIVAFNDRLQSKIIIYKVNPAMRNLERIDNGKIKTVYSYGFCLFRSPNTGKYHGFVTTKTGWIQHFELFEKGGFIGGKLVRRWKLDSQTEGCVCDDETSQAFFSEEERGIWKIGAEPEDAIWLKMIARVKDGSGLVEEVEGLTIYYATNGEGYLIASSQGEDKFTIFERKVPYRPVGNFRILGVTGTDGIDVVNVPLTPYFSQGIFVFHNAKEDPGLVGITKWEDIASSIHGGLIIDTNYWNPRKKQSISRQLDQ